MKSSKKPNIGIVAPAQLDASKSPVSNLINIVYPLSNNIYLITLRHDLFKENNKIHTYEMQYKMGLNILTKIVKYTYLQLKISYKLTKITRNVDFWIFFIGGSLVLPVLTAKVLRKNVVLALSGSSTLMAKFSNDILSKPIEILEKINLILSNKIILYSPNLIQEYGLEKYKSKILIAHEHFIDFDEFKIKKKLDERDNLVGYIGRLSGEKGTLGFVKAISLLKDENIKFLIGGNGQLRDEIEEYLVKENLNNKVKLTGWIPHDELPVHLNELKLLVLPSYTEGLPNIMLEAMACGTPVLATPVGAIPDVIKDRKTGFVLENNSPKCIAETVMRVLNYPNLDEIVKNARELVEREFTYEAAVERYKTILLLSYSHNLSENEAKSEQKNV
jgi:glycosyltransferase involved in cell wall biosynthesis